MATDISDRRGGQLQSDRRWITPAESQEGLSRYVETLRERWRVVAVTLVITLFVSILYLASASKEYQTEADVFVQASSPSDTNLQGLPLIIASTDPTRDIATAAKLITNLRVANRVAKKVDIGKTPEALLGDVTAEPIAQSNFLAVTATEGTPEDAQAVANGFAQEATKLATQDLHAAVNKTLPSLQAQARTAPSDALSAQIAELQGLVSKPNPNLLPQGSAPLPTVQSSPRPVLTLVAGTFGGLVLGITAAFAFQVLDTRLRREEQLRRLYRLPILARIPKESRSRRTDKPLSPDQLSPATSEAYRTLRGTLAASGRRPGREFQSILVTGSSPSEGKTTTGINLAASLAAAGKSVILIEADLRRPAIGRTLDIKPQYGVVSVLIESVGLEEALVTSPTFGANLGLLLAEQEGASGSMASRSGWITELFTLPTASQLIEDAGKIADFVIIDSPPLTDVIDALPLARYVDDVLLVARLGKTQLGKLAQLGELLAENGIKPSGFAVVGTARPRRSDYHYYTDPDRGRIRQLERVAPRGDRSRRRVRAGADER